jgi:hypothetical protein
VYLPQHSSLFTENLGRSDRSRLCRILHTNVEEHLFHEVHEQGQEGPRLLDADPRDANHTFGHLRGIDPPYSTAIERSLAVSSSSTSTVTLRVWPSHRCRRLR